MELHYKIAYALLTVLPAVASAANWQLVALNDNGSKFYIDGSSIVRVGPYHKAWVIESYLAAENTSSYPAIQFVSGKFLWYYDCKQKKSGVVQRVLYAGPDATGDVVESRSKKFHPDLLDDVPPDTANESLQLAACATPQYRASMHKQLSAPLGR